MRALFPIVALTFAMLVLSSCQPPSPTLSGSGMDIFSPVTIRLHPLSRIVPPSTAPDAGNHAGSLEAHIELDDQFSDTTKGVGILMIQLFDPADPAPTTTNGKLLQSWSFSLESPRDHQQYWDRTTRTYLFKLPLPNLPASRD
ncbi:MAG TPA: hypothetical protein VGN88_00560, partial [Phycisphaerae bacterium]